MISARAHGTRVPDDISIVGFDDIGIASVLTLPLTTVRVPQIEMGCAAAQNLLNRPSGQGDDCRQELGIDVIKRGSLPNLAQ